MQKWQNISFTWDEQLASAQILRDTKTDESLFSLTKVEFLRFNVKGQAYFMKTGAV